MTWKVKILTEGSKMIGLGHIYRCLALKEVLEARKINCEMIIAETEPIENFAKISNISYIDWKRNDELSSLIGGKPHCIIVDSYLASEKHYSKLANGKHQLYIIDDNNDFRYSRGTIVNPSFLANELIYPRGNRQFRFLLGSTYTLIRPVFSKSVNRTYCGNIKNILVMIGGTDVLGVSRKIVDNCMNYFPNSEIHLVYKDDESIWPENIHRYHNLDEHQIRQLMIKADFAIVGAGQTIFELIATQTPFLAIKVAENQSLNLKLLERDQLAFTVANIHHLPDVFLEAKKINNRLNIVNNQKKYKLNGANNVIDDLLLQSVQMDKMELKDSKDIYDLSSSAGVRKWSKSKKFFSFDSHEVWLRKQHEDKHTFFLVIRRKVDQKFLGQIRFSQTLDKQFLVSLSFTLDLRGKKLGSYLLDLAIEYLKKETSVNIIYAEVLNDNISSIKVFEKSGFVKWEENQNLFIFRKLLVKED